MKDDSLSDVQTFDYCPMCDCVFNNNRKHECVAFSFVPEDSDSVGKQELDPLLAKHEPALNVYAKQIWNDAIEAAASVAQEMHIKGYTAEQIRKLKK